MFRDVQLYGALDNSSAFQFENFLGLLKRKVQPGRLGLKQLVARLGEGGGRLTPVRENSTPITPSVQPPNNVFLSLDGFALEVLNETVVDGEHVFRCRKYNTCESFFDAPLDSRLISCLQVDDGDTSIVHLKTNELQQKGMKIVMNGMSVVLGLLHKTVEHSA